MSLIHVRNRNKANEDLKVKLKLTWGLITQSLPRHDERQRELWRV